MVAPAYVEESYVDHQLSTDLDSSFAFEGPEKLLEIWFWPAEDKVPADLSARGLRAIPLHKWKLILDLVSCKILSVKSSAALDAYLLSESSLFVFPHKMILKTCGTTTTLACIDEIFAAATEALFGDKPRFRFHSKAAHKIFYSRRCFMFPDKQKHVHTDWKHEVALLNSHFAGGKLYVVGDFLSDDHWYLYLAGSDAPGSGHRFGHDQTFEILMTRLDPAKTQQFVTTRKPGEKAVGEHDFGHDSGSDTMRLTGLASIFEDLVSPLHFAADSIPSPQLSDEMELSEDEELKPARGKTAIDFVHDAFSFAPCGFLSNSVSPGVEGFYYTLHVTPEAGWSYASFETNFLFSANPSAKIVDVLKRVLAVFVPGNFSVTLFSDLVCKCNARPNGPIEQLANCQDSLAKLGYKRHEKIVYDLRGEYNLLYLNFEKQG